MDRKKLLSLIMAVVFIFSFTSTAHAKDDTKVQNLLAMEEKSAKITKEDAINIGLKALKDYFNIEIDTKQYQSTCNFDTAYYDKNSFIWRLDWDKSNAKENMYFNVSIDSDTGKILSITQKKSSQESSIVPKYTKEQSQKIIEEFIEKINPGAIKNCILSNDDYRNYQYSYNPYYYFNYKRSVNGIEFNNNYISVTFDSINGEVVSYDSRWNDNLTFPKKEDVIGEEKAFELFKSNIPFSLQYIPCRSIRYYEEIPTEIRLAYAPNFLNGSLLDGKSGKILQTYPNGSADKTRDLSRNERQEFFSKYKEIKKLDKEIDRVKAEEIANRIIGELLGSEYKLDNLSYQKNSNSYGLRGVSVWSIDFRKGVTGIDGVHMVLNASTGQLTAFTKNEFYPPVQEENFTPKITWDEAYSKAINAIAEYFPNRVKDINTKQTFYNGVSTINGKKVYSTEYGFFFTRKVNDIPYNDDSIRIIIDAVTGKIKEMTSSWDDNLKFPDIKNIIQSEAAKEIYFESVKPALCYVIQGGTDENKGQSNKVDLVYMLKPNDYSYYTSDYIDAVTGKFINPNGEDTKNANEAFLKNIKGNPYEKEISILVTNGIFDTKEFDVNKKVTLYDVIKAIVNTRGYNPYMVRDYDELMFKNIEKDSEKYKYLRLAVYYGIIKNESVDLKLDENITREEMYKYIISCTRYSRLAAARGIFALNYTDAKSISSDKYGYIAIAQGLSIIDANVKTLRPKDSVTMAELAHIIYNGLQYITNNY